MSEVFGRWNQGKLDSYLVEITRDILAFKDEATGKPLVDLILDTAGQKGTGKWTVTSALDLEEILARCVATRRAARRSTSRTPAVLPTLPNWSRG